jgi:uncharacterized protein
MLQASRILLLGFLLLLSNANWAQKQKSGRVFSVSQVPNPKPGPGYVSDPDDYLSQSDEAVLNQIIRRLEDSTTVQVAVVFLHSIGEENPKEFATALFRAWGIGAKDNNNGLLILTVADQRRTEFETGYGLEGVLPDITCYRVGMQELVPFFQQGQYGQGLIAAANKFSYILNNPDVVEEVRSDQSYSDGEATLFTFLSIWGIANALFHLILLIYLYVQLKRSKQDIFDKYLAIRRARLWGFLIIFPLPFILVWWYMGAKMRQLRYAKRFSQKTGFELRIISENEEDVYLDKGQITEEEIGSADYDVWANDDPNDDVLILRYARPYTRYSTCPACHYATYYQARSVTLVSPTYSSTGQRGVYYDCKHCHHQEEKIEIIPMLTRTSSSGGGSGGGGSWGGGRSGGGGSGVSW